MQKRVAKPLLDYVVENGITNQIFNRKGQFVSLASFVPHVPKSWAKRTENLVIELKKGGLKVRYLKDYFADAGIPDNLEADLRRFLEEQEQLVLLDDQFAYHGDVFKQAVEKLRGQTGLEFEVGDAKDVLELSRKYMIPFLEKMDSLGLTKRVENKRVWKN
jgi:selenocysteine-specific elongation factor